MDRRQITIDEILTQAVDPCEQKHGNNPQSVAAHAEVVQTKQAMWRRIMTLLEARAEHGATSKEMAGAFGKQLNAISGRFTELKAMTWIKENGQVRNGAAVLVLNK